MELVRSRPYALSVDVHDTHDARGRLRPPALPVAGATRQARRATSYAPMTFVATGVPSAQMRDCEAVALRSRWLA